MKKIWTLDKPMASLSTFQLGFLSWVSILLNLVYNTGQKNEDKCNVEMQNMISIDFLTKLGSSQIIIHTAK